ncbi:Plastocyanin [Polaromonas vacuolata]|uniref:Plastocyanin n=1 Tax=Polaromonas vacuolata TaxID=37448 RepID=A0A6H2HBR6_9BURK|nr:cupredoxin family protein [Polaromonas vacuolata]QJC57270.1 Plastocyanin [Polaromonas vacuolata]
MKLSKVATVFLATLAIASLSSGALAAGNHAGGHDAGHGESAIGKPGVVAKVTRTITVEMSDSMRYTPSDIQAKKGETIRLLVKNTGKVKHEMSLGSEKYLLAHLEEMKKFPGMEHDEPGKLTLAPGTEGEIIWQFSKAGTVNFACLMPGHYEAGMKGQVKVSAK